MRDIKDLRTEDIIKEIKEQLSIDNTLSLSKICNILNFKLSSVKSRLIRDKIKFTDLKQDTTTTEEEENKTMYTTIDTTQNTTNNEIAITLKDNNKLNILLDNLDNLLKLIPVNNNENSFKISNKETIVTSIRINKEIHEEVRKISKKENISITDIINNALIDHINKI